MNPESDRSHTNALPVINVTPLIDVLLVLLIIFMVLSPLRPSRFKTLVPDAPNAEQRTVLPNPLTLVVSLDRAGRVKLNGSGGAATTEDMTAVVEELAATFRRRTEAGLMREGILDLPVSSEADRIEKTVFVKAPRSISYGDVARVIDGIKGAGADPVGLQIDELEP